MNCCSTHLDICTLKCTLPTIAAVPGRSERQCGIPGRPKSTKLTSDAYVSSNLYKVLVKFGVLGRVVVSIESKYI